jgi:hypothetical protein
VQDQTTQAVANSDAVGLSLLSLNYVEICRRGDLDHQRVAQRKCEKQKLGFELEVAKKTIE